MNCGRDLFVTIWIASQVMRRSLRHCDKLRKTRQLGTFTFQCSSGMLLRGMLKLSSSLKIVYAPSGKTNLSVRTE